MSVGEDIVLAVHEEKEAVRQPIIRSGYILDTDNSIHLNVSDTLIYYLSLI